MIPLVTVKFDGDFDLEYMTKNWWMFWHSTRGNLRNEVAVFWIKRSLFHLSADPRGAKTRQICLGSQVECLHDLSKNNLDFILNSQAQPIVLPLECGTITVERNPKLKVLFVPPYMNSGEGETFMQTVECVSCSDVAKTQNLYPHQVHSVDKILSVFTRTQPLDWMVKMEHEGQEIWMMFKNVNGYQSTSWSVAFFVLSPHDPLFRWAILGDEMGLGKTRVCLSVAKSIPGNVLILTKALIVDQWKSEFANVDPELLKRSCVISHEKFGSRSKHFFQEGDVKKSPPKRRDTSMKFDPTLEYSLVIVDEAHIFMSNSTSQTAEWLKKFLSSASCQGAKILLSSGTPFKHADGGYLGLQLVAPHIKRITGWSMVHMFLHNELKHRCALHCRRNVPAIPCLIERLHRIPMNDEMRILIEESSRHAQTSVLPSASLMHHRFRLCLESGLQCKRWWEDDQTEDRGFHPDDECVICQSDKIDPTLLNCGHEFCYECIHTGMKNRHTSAICRQQITSAQRIVESVNHSETIRMASDKFSWLLSKVTESLDQFIIFAEMSSILEIVCTALKTHGISAELLYGIMTPQKKAKVTTEFQEGRIKVLCCNLRMASTGVNLQNARQVIMWTNMASTRVTEQAKGRLTRLGSPHSVIECHTLESY